MNSLTRRAALFTLAAATVVTSALRRTPAGNDSRRVQVLLDATLPAQAPLARLWSDPADPHELLEADLVRQWRSGLHQRLRAGGRHVTALVRWDKAMVLAGLAREEGLRARTRRLGHAVFRIDFDF